MKDFGYMCIWICSVPILPEEYWWIECGELVPNFCYGSFGNILFWFFWEYCDNGMRRTSIVHRGDFSGLKTFMRRLMFCYVQSSSICNSPILSGNIIYTGILTIWLSVFYYVLSLSTYITYWVSYSHLYLHYRRHYRYSSWRRGTDFLIATSVYEYFDTVVFWLRVSYFFLLYIGCKCMKGSLSMGYVYVHTLCICVYIYIYEWSFL